MTTRVHLAPDHDSPYTPCCLRWFQELPLGDRVTANPARVTRPGPGAPRRLADRIPTDTAEPRRLGTLARIGRLLRIGRRR